MPILEGDARQDAERIIARYPPGRERSAVMPLLYLAQSLEGHLSRDAMREIGNLLRITTAEVEAVATFYTMFRRRPTGTHVVNVCTNLSCALLGGKEVLEAAHRAAGIRHDQDTSDDGLVTVLEEECLGVCELAPAVQIDVANHDRVTPERMAELIGSLRAGDVPSPARGPAPESFRHACRLLAGLDEVPA